MRAWLLATVMGMALLFGFVVTETADAAGFPLQRDVWYKFGWNFDHVPWNGTAGCPGPDTCELIGDEFAQNPENMPWRLDIDGPGGRVEIGESLTSGSPLEAIAIVAETEPGIFLDSLYYYSPSYRGDNQAFLRPGTYYLWLVPIPDHVGVATFRWTSATAPTPAAPALVVLGIASAASAAWAVRRNRRARAESAFHDFPLAAGERRAHPWKSASACRMRDRRQSPRT